jgi:hypothetical protein
MTCSTEIRQFFFPTNEVWTPDEDPRKHDTLERLVLQERLARHSDWARGKVFFVRPGARHAAHVATIARAVE